MGKISNLIEAATRLGVREVRYSLQEAEARAASRAQLACPYRQGVHCGEHGEKCRRCGWRPEVEAKRKKRIRAARGLE